MTISTLLKLTTACVATLGATLGFSTSASAGCSGPYCYTMQGQPIVKTPVQRTVPFYGTASSFSQTKLAGLGPNERLVPTQCPVSVHNPEGGKVLGCYNVVKTQTIKHVYQPPRYVQVVRPIIYVRYPVPVYPVRPACPPPVVTWGGCY